MLQRGFDAEAAGRALNGGDSTPPMETLDALRAGLEVGGASRTGTVTLADFERYHQVSWLVLAHLPGAHLLLLPPREGMFVFFPSGLVLCSPAPCLADEDETNLMFTSLPAWKVARVVRSIVLVVVVRCLLGFPLTCHGVV